MVVFGPDKLPEYARQAGRLVRQFRDFARSAQDQIREELGPEYADLKLTDLDPCQAIRRHILEAMEEDVRDHDGAANQPVLAQGQRPPFDAEAT